MKIAVLGGTGCGGRAVVEALRQKGHQVRSLSRGQFPGPPPDVQVARADTTALAQALADADVVIDHVAYSAEDVQALLKARPGGGRLFMVSSAVVYGPGGPFEESAPVAPPDAFAEGKRAAELAAQAFQGEVSVLRLGMLFGPGHALLTPQGRAPSLPAKLAERLPLPVPDFEREPRLQPLFSRDYGRLVARLVEAPLIPLLNVCGADRLTWQGWLRLAAQVLGAPSPCFIEEDRAALAARAPWLAPFLEAVLVPPLLGRGRLEALGFPETPLAEAVRETLASG